jgi:hypothetical protein
MTSIVFLNIRAFGGFFRTEREKKRKEETEEKKERGAALTAEKKQ